MLLGVVKGELSSWELVVDLAGDVALEAADGFFLGASLCESTVDVGAGAFIADHAGDDDVSERGVGVAVAAAVEPVSFLFAAGGVDRGDPAEVGEGGITALGGPGSGDGVSGVALAAPASLPVRPIDLHHRHIMGVQEAGQPGPIGTGSLHPDQLDITEAGQPRPQLPITGSRRGELGDAEQTAAFVQRCRDVDIEMGIDTLGDS